MGSQSYIDICLVSSGIHIDDNGGRGIETLDCNSDHRALKMKVYGDEPERRPRRTFFDYRRMDRRLFNRKLAEDLPNCQLPIDRNVTHSEIDAYIEATGEVFRNAMESAISRTISGPRGPRRLSPDTLDLIRQKKVLRRRLHRTQNPERYSTLRAEIRNADRDIQGAIAEYESVQWVRFLSEIQVNDRMYGRVKAAAGIKRYAKIPDLIGNDGSTAVMSSDKANMLADIVQGQADANDTSSISNTVRSDVSVFSDPSPLVTFSENFSADGTVISEENIWRQNKFLKASNIGAGLKRRSNRKSAGPDGIPDIVLRRTDGAAWKRIAIIFNHCINLGYFTVSWKRAITIPILKPDYQATNCVRLPHLVRDFFPPNGKAPYLGKADS
ncbi:uncharacterized protein [Musca autumnalis]|uniref:uncharacterized protein n=1 Tax=Musca autumnalis TaxID=221902 RepID=UPI003CF37A82